MLICLEGIDGSGKTALARGVAEKFPHLVAFQSRRAAATTSPYAGAIAERLAKVLWGSGDSTDVSPTFWLYLQAAWYVLLAENRRESRAAEIAITDGWYFKFVARLRLQGYDPRVLDATFSEVPKPDRVILLDVEPAVAWKRKAFRPLETGMHVPGSEGGHAGFIEYQGGTLRILREMAERHRWDVLTVDSNEDIETSIERVASLIVTANLRADAI
jgi:Thymidylate kinase